MHLLLWFAFFQAALPNGILHAGCSSDDAQIARLTTTDEVKVLMALDGEGPATCYEVSVHRAGQSLTGYVWGESLPAIESFVRQRERKSAEAAEQQLSLIPSPKPDEEKAAPKPTNPYVNTKFPEFSGPDANGKTINLANSRARATLITFWSPRNQASQSQLISALAIFNELHKRGLDAVGVSMDPNPQHIAPALDDVTPGWPQIADQTGLAARYHIDPKEGETFVLDVSHRIVAVGSMGSNLAATVRELLVNPQPPSDPSKRN